MGLMFLLSVSGFLLATESMASPTGTVLADTSAGGDTARVYQSFFEGNPVYYQTWDKYYYDGYDGVTIHAHGLEGDTAVNDVVYHRLKVGGTRTYREMPEFWVRESGRHDKVWVRLPWDGEGRDILVVDMELEAGDLFPVSTYPDTVYYEVDSVYWMNHAGGSLKHIRLKPTGDNAWTEALETVFDDRSQLWECEWSSRHLEFIEGVGSNLGFAYHRLGLREDNADSLWEPLRGEYYRERQADGELLFVYDYIVCMEKHDSLFYVHPDDEWVTCTDEYFWIIEETWDLDPGRPANESLRSMSRYLRLSPNPAREEVSLRWTAESPVDGACRITLYDMQGVRLRSYTADRWPYTLRVSGLPSGTYVLRVEPEDASATWQATVRLMRL